MIKKRGEIQSRTRLVKEIQISVFSGKVPRNAKVPSELVGRKEWWEGRGKLINKVVGSGRKW